MPGPFTARYLSMMGIPFRVWMYQQRTKEHRYDEVRLWMIESYSVNANPSLRDLYQTAQREGARQWFLHALLVAYRAWQTAGGRYRRGFASDEDRTRDREDRRHARQKQPQPIEGVYLLRCHDYYKIGKSIDILARLASIQTASPYPITLVHHNMIHELKCWPPYFNDLIAPPDRRKTFEIRWNDRPFAVGDYLLQREYDPQTEEYTERICLHRVTHIMDTPRFMPPGYVTMSVVLLGVNDGAGYSETAEEVPA